MFQTEMNNFYNWVSAPFTQNIPGWKAFIAVLILLVIAWFVYDNLQIIKEAL